MSGQDCRQLTLFPVDSPASPFLSPGSAEARRTTVTSGRKCSELYKKSGPLGSLVRTLLVSSAWRSTRCFLTWKVSATPAKRLLFRLVPSMPRTGETDVRLLPTVTAQDYKHRGPNSKQQGLPEYVRMGPTPKVSDSKGSGSAGSKSAYHDLKHHNLKGTVMFFPTPTKLDATCGDLEGKEFTGTRHAMKLIQAAKLYATPQARDYRTGDKKQFADPKRSQNLNDQIGGQLNPTWVEWLMGFPIGWTDLDA